MTRERFWARVDVRGPDECWPWTGSSLRDGYGLVSNGRGGRRQTATRAMLKNFGFVLPDDKRACHHCDNPICVNPIHLFIGSERANQIDRVLKGRCGSPIPDSVVLEIRSRCAAGESKQQVADSLGLQCDYVRAIARGAKRKILASDYPTSCAQRIHDEGRERALRDDPNLDAPFRLERARK
jgi:hypothetical protein